MAKETLEKLRNLITEWREASDGQSLENVKAPVQLLLEDVCQTLDIEPEAIGL